MDNLPQIISGASYGGGTLENIISGMKENAYRNKIMALLNNPAALAAMASKLTAPLNQGLTQSVTNQVQGNMAERGLSQAPGVFAASESQALAPFYQQNQNTALQTVMQLLGMPAGTFKNPSNNSGALQMFLKTLGNKGAGGQTNDGSYTAFPDLYTPDPSVAPFFPDPSAGGDWSMIPTMMQPPQG